MRILENRNDLTLRNEFLEVCLPATPDVGPNTLLFTIRRADTNGFMLRARYEGATCSGSTRVAKNELHSTLRLDDGEYSWFLELREGEPFLRVREAFHGGVTARLQPSRFVLDLSEFAARDFCFDGWNGTTATIRDASTFAQQHGLAREVLCSLGAQTVFGQVGAPWVALSDGSTCVAMIPIHGGDWEFPGNVALRLQCVDGRLQLSGETRAGSREWLLLLGEARDWFPREGEAATTIFQIKARVGDLPPAKTLTWQLDAPEPEEPQLWTDAVGVLAARERLQAPEWSGLLDSVPHRKDEPRSPEESGSCCFGLFGTTDSFPDGVLWLQRGDENAGCALAVQIRDWAEERARRFAEGGFLGAGLDVVALRPLKLCLYWHDLLRGSRLQNTEDAARTRRALLFCAHCVFDRDYFDWESAVAPPVSPHSLRRFLLEEEYSDTMGCQNFHSDIYSFLGAMGLAFPKHPLSTIWIEHAERMARWELENYVMPDGTYVESDNYYQHFFGLIYYLGWALHRAGRPKLLQHPRLKAGLEYWVRAQTPPLLCTGSPATAWFGTYCESPANRPISQMLPLGDCGLNWGGQAMPSFLHHAANFYAQDEPMLAGALEWTWQRAGRPLAQYSFLLQEMLTQKLDGVAPREYSHCSTELQGHGALLRAAVGLPRETAVLVSGGRATSHMHFDSGSLQLWHAGIPLVVDAGYIHDEFSIGREYAGARWKHSTLTFGKWGSELGAGDWGMEHRAPLHAKCFSEEFDTVEVDLSHANRRGATWRDFEQLVSIEAYRQILFAKNRYLVVHDRVARSIYPATWHLWTLSQTEKIEENRVRIFGRFGVDLCLTFLQPSAPHIHVEEYSAARHLWVNQNAARDFLVVLQPLLPDETPRRVAATASGAVISNDWETDEISYEDSNLRCWVRRNGQPHFSTV